MIDTCLICGTEIPPGPDCCSAECEDLFTRLWKIEDLIYLALSFVTCDKHLIFGRCDDPANDEFKQHRCELPEGSTHAGEPIHICLCGKVWGDSPALTDSQYQVAAFIKAVE